MKLDHRSLDRSKNGSHPPNFTETQPSADEGSLKSTNPRRMKLDHRLLDRLIRRRTKPFAARVKASRVIRMILETSDSPATKQRRIAADQRQASHPRSQRLNRLDGRHVPTDTWPPLGALFTCFPEANPRESLGDSAPRGNQDAGVRGSVSAPRARRTRAAATGSTCAPGFLRRRAPLPGGEISAPSDPAAKRPRFFGWLLRDEERRAHGDPGGSGADGHLATRGSCGTRGASPEA